MKRELEKQVADLAERLGLDEEQTEAVRAALLARAEKQKEIGKKMFTRKATLEDLIASDEENFSESDAAIAALLDEGQLESFAEYQHERETKRVESKADEELQSLQDVADLTDEQADQAWRVFADLAIEERPGEVPEGATVEDFGGFLDDAIGKRVDALTPILAPEELDAYRGEAQEFRDGMVAHHQPCHRHGDRVAGRDKARIRARQPCGAALASCMFATRWRGLNRAAILAFSTLVALGLCSLQSWQSKAVSTRG